MSAPVLPDVLLVVDMQNDYCHPEGALGVRGARIADIDRVVTANEELIARYRSLGRRVLFARTHHSPMTDSLVWRMRTPAVEGGDAAPEICSPGSWGAELFRLEAQHDDWVITKHRYSAFYGTNLELILKAHAIGSLLVTGVLTNVCVESTVRDAFMRGFLPTVVPEACGAPTAAEHDMAVHNIARYFGRALSLEDIRATELEAAR
jgi:ureidoacrylate peracid hydrolase